MGNVIVSSITRTPVDQGGGVWGSVSVAGGSLTPFNSVNFNGLADAASITGLIGAWGTYANGYGCQGDTSLKYPGATSSCAISIAGSSTGDGNDGNGVFGYTVPITGSLGEGDNLWQATLIYIPLGFSFANDSFLKFLRYSQTGTSEKINTYIQSAGSEQSTWNIQNNLYTQFQADTNRATGIGLVKGQWNWVVEQLGISATTSLSVRRLWINDLFSFEHVGQPNQDVTTKWVDSSQILQTATWTPTSGGFPLLLDASQTLSSMFMSTYWNGSAPQNQSWNVQQHTFYNSEVGMEADAYGNKFPKSTQIGIQ